MDTWNERSKADVAADREADAFQAGQLGTGHFAKTFLEQQAYDRGAASRGGGGGAPISPIALPFLAMMAVGFWPLCGALTLGSGVGTFVLMSLVLQRQSVGVAFLVALAAAVAGLSQQLMGAVGGFAVGLFRHEGAVNLGWLMLGLALCGAAAQWMLHRGSKP